MKKPMYVFNVKRIVILLLSVFLFISCLKDPKWDIDMKVPLFQTNLKISDIVADSLMKLDQNDNITLVLDLDLLNFTTDSFVNLPDSIYYSKYTIPFGATVPPGVLVMKKTESKFYDLKGAKLTEVKIKSGKLTVSAFNYVNASAYIEYSLDNSLLYGAPVKLSGIMPSYLATGNSLQKEFDVSEMFLNLRESSYLYNSLKSTVKLYSDPNATESIVVKVNDSVTMLVRFEGIVLEYARGYFGQHSKSKDGSEKFSFLSKLGIDYLDLDKIKMSITLENSMGADFSFRINKLVGIGKNEIPLNSEWIGKEIQVARAVESYTSPNRVKPTKYVLDFETSNIEDFFENLPSNISYSVSATLNPLGNISTGNDFVYAANGLQSKLHTEIPLNFAIKGLRLNDTLNYEIKDKEARLKQSDLEFYVENAFPTSFSFKIIMLNEYNNPIDSVVPSDEIKSAQVDDNGNVIKSIKSYFTARLNESQTRNLINCKKAVISALINTGGEAKQKVKFKTNNNLNIVIIGLFKVVVK